MSTYADTSFGPVAIIPASAMRDNRTLLRRTNPDDIPINAAYYLTPNRNPPPSTSSAPSYPIGRDRERDRDRYDVGYNFGASHPAPPSSPGSYRRMGNAMVQGPIHGPSYPYSVSSMHTPRTQRRVYRTTASSVAGSAPERATIYRTRSYSTNIFHEPEGRVPIGHLKSVSGPYKNPDALYRKYRYRRTASGGLTPALGPGDAIEMMDLPPSSRRSIAAIDTFGHDVGGYGVDTQRGLRRHYAPTYTSGYPPSSVYRSERRTGFNYGLLPRIILKVAQLISGAIVIGCICGVTGGQVLGSYTRATRTQGQIFVVVIAAIALIFTFALLFTIVLARRYKIWRNVDAGWNATATFMYLIAASVEAWYANCYPPFGQTYGVACRLPAWVAAAVFAFFNVIFYAADLASAVLAGSTVFSV